MPKHKIRYLKATKAYDEIDDNINEYEKLDKQIEEENKKIFLEVLNSEKQVEVSESKNEFLNTEDLQEILDNNEPLKEKVEEITKETKPNLEDTDEMDMTFFDDYKGKKKKNRK